MSTICWNTVCSSTVFWSTVFWRTVFLSTLCWSTVFWSTICWSTICWSTVQTHNILQHSKAQKPTIFNNGRYTTNFPTDPHTVTTTDIKTNMHHIHTSIVSRHLATRGNNKILRTPPPHTSNSEEILPRLTRRTLAQLRTNKSPFLKSYLIIIIIIFI